MSIPAGIWDALSLLMAFSSARSRIYCISYNDNIERQVTQEKSPGSAAEIKPGTQDMCLKPLKNKQARFPSLKYNLKTFGNFDGIPSVTLKDYTTL